jgi:hypothetical protein
MRYLLTGRGARWALPHGPCGMHDPATLAGGGHRSHPTYGLDPYARWPFLGQNFLERRLGEAREALKRLV